MKRLLIIFTILGIGGVISLIGYNRNRHILDNLKYTTATITDVYNMTGDIIVPKVRKAIPTYKIKYSYTISGENFSGWEIINIDDMKYKFPMDFKVGTKAQIAYKTNEPDQGKLRCKLRLSQDKIDLSLFTSE